MRKKVVYTVLLLEALLCMLFGCTAQTYSVDYCGEKSMYDGAMDAYHAGKEVVLYYPITASDTNYIFRLDGEKLLNVEYDNEKGYFIIRFTMPDHDVKLECVTENASAAVVPETNTETETEPLRFLTLIKSYHYNKEYDAETSLLLAQNRYSCVTLHADDIGDFPALAETLEQNAAMEKRSMDDEFDNLIGFAKESLSAGGTEYFRQQVSSLDILVRRADSLVVSLLSDSYADYGFIEGYRAFHGTNLDAETGCELALNDVICDMDSVIQIIKKELNRYTWQGEYHSETAVEDYFAETPEDGISWTLDYNGVTFYFMPGDLCDAGFGNQTATVSFTEHPEVFVKKYFGEPTAYITALAQNLPYFTNLDAEPDLEEINSMNFVGDEGIGYGSFGLYTDIDSYYYSEDLFAYAYHPYYVKTADDGHYLYLFCEQTEEGSRDMRLLVFDASGGRYTKVGEINACPGFMFPDSFIVPSDPYGFRLDNRDTPEQEEVYTVGENGMPVLK